MAKYSNVVYLGWANIGSLKNQLTQLAWQLDLDINVDSTAGITGRTVAFQVKGDNENVVEFADIFEDSMYRMQGYGGRKGYEQQKEEEYQKEQTQALLKAEKIFRKNLKNSNCQHKEKTWMDCQNAFSYWADPCGPRIENGKIAGTKLCDVARDIWRSACKETGYRD